MTSKLTKTHRDTLSLIDTKQHIEICTSIGRSLGKAMFADGADAKPIMASLQTLYSWGYFDDEELFYYGLRFSRLTINDKGTKALLEMERSDA
tara:strand:- start:1427 stop:1705 length:279 start_codon:yes stop_codon:yes gene_type:complete